METRQDSDAKTAPEPDAGRRKLFKLAATAGGVVAAGALFPQSWQKPIAQIGAVPAHAATSAAAPDLGPKITILRSGDYPPTVLNAQTFRTSIARPSANGSDPLYNYYAQFSFVDRAAGVGLDSLNSGVAQVGVGVSISNLAKQDSKRTGTVTPCTGAITWQTLTGWSGTDLPKFIDLGAGSGVVTFPFQTPCYIDESATVKFQVRVGKRISDTATAYLNGVDGI